MTTTFRRVVTGLDEQGRSCVIIDGQPQPMSSTGGLVWRTDALPADNAGRDDAAAGVSFGGDMMRRGGSSFMVVELPAGNDAFMHATDTIDYIVVLSGRITLVLEAGEAALGPGDLVVDRGVHHAWRNDGLEPAAIAVIMLPAHPLAGKRARQA